MMQTISLQKNVASSPTRLRNIECCPDLQNHTWQNVNEPTSRQYRVKPKHDATTVESAWCGQSFLCVWVRSSQSSACNTNAFLLDLPRSQLWYALLASLFDSL